MDTKREDDTGAAMAATSVSLGSELNAFVVAILAGPLSWVVWVWPTVDESGYVPEWVYAGFFVTLALLATGVGALGGSGTGAFLRLSLLSYVSAMGTVYAWWSSADGTGLFIIGIVMLALPVLAGAFIFVGAGRGMKQVVARKHGGHP